MGPISSAVVMTRYKGIKQVKIKFPGKHVNTYKHTQGGNSEIVLATPYYGY